MPTSPHQLFDSAGLRIAGVVPWGGRVFTSRAGVYVVSLRDDPGSAAGARAAPVCAERVRGWIEVAGEMTLDGERAEVEGVCAFLQSFWLPDEAVVYIGKATSLQKRLRQFWRHRLGERRPHAGGHWLKALRTLEDLHVFFAEAESPAHSAALEAALVDRFVAGVSAGTRAGLGNPVVAVPFANRSHPRGARKTTALRGQTARG